MTITVGTDTYVTVAEADAYLALYYSSTDAQYKVWDACATGDKEIFLRNATRSIERLMFAGRKVDTSQALFFPRVVALPRPNRRNDLYYPHANISQYEQIYKGNDDVPDEIKNAQIEEALELSSPSTATKKFNKISGAVESYSIGHYSEKRKTVNTAANSPATILRSLRAQEYAQAFVGGGKRVY